MFNDIEQRCKLLRDFFGAYDSSHFYTDTKILLAMTTRMTLDAEGMRVSRWGFFSYQSNPTNQQAHILKGLDSTDSATTIDENGALIKTQTTFSWVRRIGRR